MSDHKRNTTGLKPFKKGQTGNPKGRPPKLPELDELMAKVLGAESGDKTAAEVLLDKLYLKAKQGDIRAAEVLLNRGYGLPKQKHIHVGDPAEPIVFKTDDRFTT